MTYPVETITRSSKGHVAAMAKTPDAKSTPLTHRELRRKVVSMLDEGYSRREVAGALGIPLSRVRRIAITAGISCSTGRSRKLSTHPRRVVFDVIDTLAIKAGTSRSTMTSRILDAAAPDIASAERLLGKAALPKRQYERVKS
jgi:hypothetical protein